MTESARAELHDASAHSTLTIALMIGSFTVFPYVSAHFVANVGMTEQQLPVIYVVGGLLTLFASPIIGRLTDQIGKLTIYRIIAPASAVAPRRPRVMSIPE